MPYQITISSDNPKTGHIPVTTSEASTCPDSCVLKQGGCYAKQGPMLWHWRRVTDGRRGGSFKTLLNTIASLPKGQLWRHNQAGDLPGANEQIDAVMLDKLANANIDKRGFTYTHKNVETNLANRLAVASANSKGFTINLSANNLAHADKLADLQIAPVVVILPEHVETNCLTPNGRKVVVCPAQTHDDITCLKCKLCAIPNRKAIIGFIAHGSSRNKALANTGNKL